MSANLSNPSKDDFLPMRFAINLLAALAAIIQSAGTLLLALLWLPTLVQSLVGPEPHAFWDLSRAMGIVGYLLLWFSIVWGLLITNKLSLKLGALAVTDLHEFFSLLGLTFAFLHVVVLLGDQYIKYNFAQLIIPFASVNYQPLWVGIGQIAFYLLVPVTFTFYIRKWIGYSAFRWIHFGSFATYSLVTIHSLLAGSDTKTLPMLLMYAGTGTMVFFLTMFRMFTMAKPRTA